MSSDRVESYDSSTLKQIIDSIPGSIYWKDSKGTYLGCNMVMVETAGLSSIEDIVGKTDFELWPDNAERIRKNDLATMETGETSSQEEEVKVQSGQIMHFRSVKIPLRDKSGNIIGVIGNSLNITAEKMAVVLEREKAIIQEKVKTMKLLAGTIAHEIRTPLGTISAIAEHIRFILPNIRKLASIAEANHLTVPLSQDELEYIYNVPDSLGNVVNKAGNFISMLLQKVRADEERADSSEILSIVECVDEALDEYQRSEEVKIVWERKANFYFQGEKIAFLHIIFNLLKNAIFYVQKARKGKVEIWAEIGQENNILHFRDTGTGISPECLPYIFQHFYSKTRHGTGIGLAYCKLVMQGFGGEIQCDSKYGEYTHFKLTFPKLENMQSTSP